MSTKEGQTMDDQIDPYEYEPCNCRAFIPNGMRKWEPRMREELMEALYRAGAVEGVIELEEVDGGIQLTATGKLYTAVKRLIEQKDNHIAEQHDHIRRLWEEKQAGAA